jgi:beta-N-acetylhexosaminidase
MMTAAAGCAGETSAPAPVTPAPVSTPEPTAAPTPEPTPESTPQPTIAPTPVPTPEEPQDPIERLIASMSDRELIGQMVMIGFSGQSDMDDDTISLMQEYDVGNVILFGWNTNTFAQTKKLTERIRSHNATDIPLTIGIDIEGGSVTRFKGQWKPFISSAKKLGEANDPERVFEQYKRIGEKLREIGVNIDLAPVMDIAPHPSATFLGNRLFGSDPDRVAPLIREAVKGLHAGGCAAMGKHFPGHGNTAADSHHTLPVLDATRDEMEAYELVPFQAGVDEGLDAMLVAHLSYPHVDADYITSVSPTVITGILRDEMGFDGVVFSDDMRMKGIRDRYPVGEAAVMHILAGGDVVLIGMHYKLQSAVLDGLYQAVQDGRLTRGRLEESVRRIFRMKQAYNEGFAAA